MVVAILLTILYLTGCGNAATETASTEANVTTWESGDIESWETETILTEDILVEDIQVEEIVVNEIQIESHNAKDLRHDLAEQNLYFDISDGVILIWGTDYCYEDNKLMAKVEFDESTEEIQTVTINSTVITKDVYDLLGEYTNKFILDQFL